MYIHMCVCVYVSLSLYIHIYIHIHTYMSGSGIGGLLGRQPLVLALPPRRVPCGLGLQIVE